MPNSLKEYHLVDLLTGAKSLADLHRWLQHVNRGNVRVERHDPGSDDQANPSS